MLPKQKHLSIIQSLDRLLGMSTFEGDFSFISFERHLYGELNKAKHQQLVNILDTHHINLDRREGKRIKLCFLYFLIYLSMFRSVYNSFLSRCQFVKR